MIVLCYSMYARGGDLIEHMNGKCRSCVVAFLYARGR